MTAMTAQSRSRERVPASEFPVSPSICHPQAPGEGCVSGFLDALRAEEDCDALQQPYALRSPSITQVETTGVQLTSDSTVNFAVEPIYLAKKAQMQHDDDIDEVMFVADTLVDDGPGAVKSSFRSGSTMSLTEDYADREASRRISASDFEVIRPVQRGQQSSRKGELVIGRKSDTGRFYAIKVFRKASVGADQRGSAYARREQEALRLVTERAVPFAVQLYWSFQDDKALYLIMNYVASDLRTFVECYGVLALSDAIVLASQLVQGLTALHTVGIVHCNINPSGLFVENGYLVIADFGNAHFAVERLEQTARREAKGQWNREIEPYQAPELLLEWSPHVASDWWSFGLVLCYMLAAQHPLLEPHELEDVHPAVLASKLLHGELPRWIVPGDESSFANILRQCLQRNPALRLSDEGVKAHPFFADVEWDLAATSQPPVYPSFAGPDSLRSLAYTPDTRRRSTGTDALYKGTLLSSSQYLGNIDDFSFTWDFGSGGFRCSGKTSTIESSTGGLQDSCANLNSRRSLARYEDCRNSQDVDYGVMMPSEFGVCLPAVPSARKYGTIRKFSSINFDLDTLDTVPASGRINPLGVSPPSQPRKSTSTFTSPFTSTPGTTRKKLRKKPRSESTPGSAPLPPPPVLDLPPGIEQIGHGIGYTRRVDAVYSRLSFPTLAPRSCQGIFSREYFIGLSPRKRAGNAGSERYDSARPEGGREALGASADDQSEDAMDAVMREVYGPRWNAGASISDVSHGADPRAYVALVKAAAKVQSVGLGLGDTAPDSTNTQLRVVPMELSTLSPASTLRLVSPSVRDLRLG